MAPQRHLKVSLKCRKVFGQNEFSVMHAPPNTFTHVLGEPCGNRSIEVSDVSLLIKEHVVEGGFV
jgi:hypothetical protein